jgi:hypothetical protein
MRRILALAISAALLLAAAAPSRLPAREPREQPLPAKRSPMAVRPWKSSTSPARDLSKAPGYGDEGAFVPLAELLKLAEEARDQAQAREEAGTPEEKAGRLHHKPGAFWALG